MASANPYADFTKMFSDFKAPNFDYHQAFTVIQNNTEAASAMNQALAENAKAISQRQAEIARENIERVLEMSRDMMSSGSPELSMAKQADAAKEIFESSLSNMREISEMCSKSSFEVIDMMNRQMANSINQMSKMSA